MRLLASGAFHKVRRQSARSWHFPRSSDLSDWKNHRSKNSQPRNFVSANSAFSGLRVEGVGHKATMDYHSFRCRRLLLLLRLLPPLLVLLQRRLVLRKRRLLLLLRLLLRRTTIGRCHGRDRGCYCHTLCMYVVVWLIACLLTCGSVCSRICARPIAMPGCHHILRFELLNTRSQPKRFCASSLKPERALKPNSSMTRTQTPQRCTLARAS